MSKCNCCGSEQNTPIFAMKGYQLVSCAECGLAFIANPPSQDELARLYSLDGAHYHAELQDPTSVQYQRIARISAQHLRFVHKVADGGRLVDVGCSTGQFLGRALAEGFDGSGVEFSPESATFAAAHTGVAIERGSIHDCRLAPGSVDVLTMFDVIEHVPDPAADLAAAWRLLKPGGWLVLSTPNIDGLFPRLSYSLAHRLDYWPHPEPPYHLYQFSVKTLAAMLEKAGFEAGPVEHCAIDLAYTFGTPSTLVHSPKRLAYAAVFAPVAAVGPWLGQGDWFYMAARKPLAASAELSLPKVA